VIVERSQADWLQDIREAISNIQRYRAAVERNPDAFPLGMLEQATMDNLTIIGEAAKHLSEDVTSRAPEIPWRRIAGFRNVVVHEYWGRDPEIIANTIDEHLPQLDAALARVQRELIEERESKNGFI